MTDKRISRKARATKRAGKSANAGRRSTQPTAGLFMRDAASIARVMATRRVSPGGLGSAIRTVQYVLNRSGPGLPAARRRELERAKALLRARAARDTETRTATRKPAPVRARREHQELESQRELSRHSRQERDRLDSLERSALAERSLRPRLAPRANTESRRSGRRTVTTRAGRHTRDHR